MIDNETALIDHESEEIELPRGISQLYTTEDKRGNAFHIQLPETKKNNIGLSFERTQNGKQSITEARG